MSPGSSASWYWFFEVEEVHVPTRVASNYVVIFQECTTAGTGIAVFLRLDYRSSAQRWRSRASRAGSLRVAKLAEIFKSYTFSYTFYSYWK